MTGRNARFTQGSVSRHVMVMASTSALSLFAVFLVDILTLFYVALLHEPELLAAVGIAKVLIFLNSALANGLIIAAASVLSERIGHKRSHSLKQLTTSLLLMVVTVSGVCAAIQLALMAPITHWLGAHDGVYEAARDFIWLILPCAVLQSVMQMTAQMLRTAGDSRRALWVVLCAAGTLAVADPLLIFVLGLGLKGAAIAYGISAVVSTALGLYWVRRQIGLALWVRPKRLRLYARRIFSVAFPAMVANLATPVGLAYLVSTVSVYGTSALAAMAVLDRVMQFCFCAFFALPSALAPVLGQNIGAHLDKRVKAAIVFTRRVVVAYGVALWALLLASCGIIADFYGLQGEGRDLFFAFCRIGAGLWVLIGLDFVAIAVFITMGRPWLIAVFAWLRSTLGTIPFIYVATHLFGSSGTMSGMFAGNALVAIVSIFTASRVARSFFTRRARPTCVGVS